MAPPLNLAKLISEPFGPYPEEKILASSFADKEHKKGVLRDVFMDMGGKATGLNHTEFLVVAPPLASIRFFGVLDVEELGWLSPQGLDWLQKDFRERDEQENGVINSGLTLQNLYGTRPGGGSRISVWIQCVKTRPAGCFTVKGEETSLILYSEPHYPDAPKQVYRSYRINSLDVETYTQSRDFITRSRLLSYIVSLKNDSPTPGGPPHRTVSWLVSEMISYHQEQTRHRRFIFDAENDSDVDDEGITLRPRHPRHVSRAEVQRLLARHAEWLLAQQLTTSRREHHHINLLDLYKFCRMLKKDGKLDLGRYGPDQGWERRLEKFCINPKPKPTTSTSSSKVTSTSSPRPGSGRRSATATVTPAQPRPELNGYDSGDSEASSSAAEDSDSDRDTQLALAKRVPSYCFNRYCQQMDSFRWYCPAQNCEYTFDLTKPPPPGTTSLSIADLRYPDSLPHRDHSFLMKKTWRVKDGRVQQISNKVICQHLRAHMRAKGLDYDDARKGKLKYWPDEHPMEGIEKTHSDAHRDVKHEMEY